MILCGKKSPPS